MKQLVLWMLLCTTAGVAKAQGYTGRVYQDRNSNGVYDTGEQGLGGVKVSNGLHVVLTAADGTYTLPVYDKARFIFISTPAGYRFSKTFYTRIAAGNASYDFGVQAVRAVAAGGKARFVRMTDTETFRYGQWVTDIKNYIRNEGADFLIHTGDICYEKGMQFHAQQINSETMGVPTYYCIGNHDLVKGAYGEELYESLFGPVYYSFDVGEVHFVVTPMLYGDYKASYTAADVYNWLQQDLALTDKKQSLVLFNHDLLTYDSLFLYKNGKGAAINLNDHQLKAWIYGHWHNNFSRVHGNNGIRSICAGPAADGGIDNAASNFDVITVGRQGVQQVQRRYTYVDNQLTVLSPTAAGVALQGDSLTISVNAYHTASVVKAVHYRLYDRNGQLRRQVALQPVTDWNWQARIPLPADYASTVYNGQATATLGNGKVLFASDTFRISKLKGTAGSEWATMLGNALRNTHVANKGVMQPKLLWMNNAGGHIWKGAPIYAAGKVFIATIDDEENTQCGITALDARTGRISWQYKTRNSIKQAISYSEGVVLGTDAEGITYALRAADGHLLWKSEARMQSLAVYDAGGVVKDGFYYTGSGNYMQAFRISTGEVLWTNKDWKGGEGTPAAMAIQDNLLVTGANWQSLFGHDIRTGQLLWKRSDEGLRFRSGGASFYDKQVYVTGINKLHVLDAMSGETQDSIPVPYALKTMTAPVVTDQHIILCTAEHGIVAYDRQSKQLSWTFRPEEALFYSAPYTLYPAATVEATPVRVGDKLIVGASDGYLYVLEAGSGKVSARYHFGSPVFAEVAVSGNLLFAADFAGNVAAFVLPVK